MHIHIIYFKLHKKYNFIYIISNVCLCERDNRFIYIYIYINYWNDLYLTMTNYKLLQPLLSHLSQ